MGLGNILKKVTETISDQVVEKQRQTPTAVAIPRDHVDQFVDGPFKMDEHYFQVRVNEMYLSAERKWFTLIDPLVFVVTEFTYKGKGMQAVPAVVGPLMMKDKIQEIPRGMLFRDTRVAGLHPWRGGRLVLSVVLCQVRTGDYARPLVQVIESAARELNLSAAISPYFQIASVVIDGFEALLGLKDTAPLVALRSEFDEDAGGFFPGFFALIDKPDVDPQTLWVRNNQLMKHTNVAKFEPYRDADYVLYSVIKDPDNRRSDVNNLPFQELWERVQREAAERGGKNYENARVDMAALWQTMVLSPDLIPAQAEALADDYADKMKRIYERAVAIGKRGGESGGTAPELDRVRSKALSILES